MGVPAFFRWLSRKYPSVIIECVEKKVEIRFVYFVSQKCSHFQTHLHLFFLKIFFRTLMKQREEIFMKMQRCQILTILSLTISIWT